MWTEITEQEFEALKPKINHMSKDEVGSGYEITYWNRRRFVPDHLSKNSQPVCKYKTVYGKGTYYKWVEETPANPDVTIVQAPSPCWWLDPDPEKMFHDAKRGWHTEPYLWDRLFMRIAREISKMSKCASRQIGAIAVKDRQILSMGFNGSPAGSDLCQYPRQEYPGNRWTCPRKKLGFKSGEGIEFCPAQHAEENCVANAAKTGTSLKGATLYCFCAMPCQKCAGALINAGITEIVCLVGDEYDTLAKLLLEQAKVTVRTVAEDVL